MAQPIPKKKIGTGKLNTNSKDGIQKKRRINIDISVT
jgi:hypothetical protein